ncbi:MAG: hypothetical protein ACRYG6_15610 [Janthinobacterium lividum]
MAQGESRTRETRNGTSRPGEPPHGAAPAPVGGVTVPAHRRDAAEAGLEVTGQFLAFETGLYAVDVVSARSVATDVGLRLPCVRIQPLPASAGAGQAFVSGAAEGGWLAGGATAFVLVVGGRTRVMLTVYKAAGGMAPPELRVRPLGAAMGLTVPEVSEAPGPDAPEPPRRTVVVTPAVPAAATPPVQAADVPPAQVAHPAPIPGAGRPGVVLMAHVQGVGDVSADAQGWAGRAGSRAPVEGFSVAVDGVDASEIEYQAILGDQWNTPWTRGGAFCGSRGMALPILGFRVRLVGAATERLECRYWGAFVGRGEVGPLGNGAACQAGQAFLEALRIVVTPRGSGNALPEALPAAAEGIRAKAPRGRR